MNYSNKYVYKPKDIGAKNVNNNNTKGKNDSSATSSGDTNRGKNSKSSEPVHHSPPSLEKVWKVSSENLEELKKSANKYAVLAEDGIKEKDVEKNGNTPNEEEDVYENRNEAVKSVIANEVIGNASS